MNKFLINFLIQGVSKISGFLKKYFIIIVLGTTKLGDKFKIIFTWPNIIRRIFIDGSIDYILTPYLLESINDSHNFEKKTQAIINTLGLILIFIIISRLIIYYFYPSSMYDLLGFFTIIPMTFTVIATCILQSQRQFTYSNFGQVINNIMFIIIGYFYWKKQKNFLGLWMATWIGFIVHNIYLWYKIYNNNNLPWNWHFLPINIILDIFKSCIFQLSNKLHSIVINYLGSRLVIEGILSSLDFIDNIISSVMGIGINTIITILTNDLFAYFRDKKEIYRMECQSIIVGMMLITLLISTYLIINGCFLIDFLIYNFNNINGNLLKPMLQWSAGQIFFMGSIKIFQRILIIEKKINITVIIGIACSMISLMVELIFFKTHHFYAVIFSQYLCIAIELIFLLKILNNCPQWINLWKDLKIAVVIKDIMIIIGGCSIIYKINQLYGSQSLVKFLLINGIWGLLIGYGLWHRIKFFIKKKE